MRKIVLFILGGFMTLTSCKKDITCECVYENKMIFTKKIKQTHSIQQTENECSGYDTTMIGEIWDCSIIK